MFCAKIGIGAKIGIAKWKIFQPANNPRYHQFYFLKRARIPIHRLRAFAILCHYNTVLFAILSSVFLTRKRS